MSCRLHEMQQSAVPFLVRPFKALQPQALNHFQGDVNQNVQKIEVPGKNIHKNFMVPGLENRLGNANQTSDA